MIYFDNGATTYPKPKCVINAVCDTLSKVGGNPSRSSHKLSVMAGEEVYKTRECVANFIGAPSPENVVFTYNATYALNMAIKTMITEKCHVITSDIEHNSVVRPLRSLIDRLGIEVSNYNSDLPVFKSIANLIRPDTKFIVSTLSSNVTGKEVDFSSLSYVAKKHSLKLIVDASQALGHRKIDLSACDCDAICAPAHKALFGMQGTGFVYFKDSTRNCEFIEGGSGTNSIEYYMPSQLPEAYEAGTLATPGIVALRRGMEFVSSIGIDNVEKHLNMLRILTTEGLSNIEGIRLYESYGGHIIFNLYDIPSSAISLVLDKHSVCTRGGLHCAPSAHIKLGTIDQGVVRVTFSIMNTVDEVEKFVAIMKKIAKHYREKRNFQ
jgi:selenocysteine lyase/cysteine desulfurase